MFDPVILKYQLRDAAIYWLVIPATVILSGFGIDLFAGLSPIPQLLILRISAFILLGIGLLFIWASMRDLTKAGGTSNPLRPPKKIVTTGSYSICRHPMFFGYDLCALSVIILFRSPGMLCISFPVFLIVQIWFLRKEEKILRFKFKQLYTDYMKTTPFIIPFIASKKNISDNDS